MAGRGVSALFESVNTLGDDDGASSRSSGGSGGGGGGGGGGTGGEGEPSADTAMGSGALEGAHVSAFGGDAGGDFHEARGASTRYHVSAFGGDASDDVEMGNLELVRPQQVPAFAGDPGKPSARGGGGGSSAQVDATGDQRGDNDGGIKGKDEDALHFPSDRTTPPASSESSPLPS